MGELRKWTLGHTPGVSVILPHASALVVSVQHPQYTQRVHPDCTQPSVARLTCLVLHYTIFSQSLSPLHIARNQGGILLSPAV